MAGHQAVVRRSSSTSRPSAGISQCLGQLRPRRSGEGAHHDRNRILVIAAQGLTPGDSCQHGRDHIPGYLAEDTSPWPIERLLDHVIVKLKNSATFNIAIMRQERMLGSRDRNTPRPQSFCVDPHEQASGGADANNHLRPRRPDQVIMNPNDLQRREHALKAA